MSNMVRRGGIVPPDTFILDDPAHCVRVNKKWLPIVIALLHRGRLYDYWTYDREAQITGMYNIDTLIAALARGDECEVDGMLLRQKPGNPCVLQQLQGEAGWVDVFDYALCQKQGKAASLFASYTQVWEEYNSITNNIENGGDITVIYNNLAGVPQQDKKVILCALLNYMVRMLCNIVVAEKEGRLNENIQNDVSKTEFLTAVSEALTSIGTKASALLVEAGTVLGVATLVAAAAALLLRAIQAAALNHEKSIYQDAARQRRIACEFSRVLQSNGWLIPTYGQLMTAIEQSLFTGEDKQVADTIYAMLQVPEIWYSVLEIGDVIAKSYIPVDCECGKWKVGFDFTGGLQHGWRPAPCFWTISIRKAAVITAAGFTAPWDSSGVYEDILIMRRGGFNLERFAVSLSKPLQWPNSGLWFANDAVPRILPNRFLPGMYSYAPANGAWLGWNLQESIQLNEWFTIGVTGDSVKGSFYNPLDHVITQVALYGSGRCPFADAVDWDGTDW
jgi:hypothetical protein